MESIRLGNSTHFEATRERRSKKVSLLVVLGTASVALATPPFGIVLNQILAKGTVLDNISQHVQIAKNLDGSVDPWQLQLQAQGATDFYVQQLVVAPGGYGGWHTHPGILIGTVVSGAIDFYDANCQKHSFTTGQVFMENNQVHSIINT